jgi:hypothetical protein
MQYLGKLSIILGKKLSDSTVFCGWYNKALELFIFTTILLPFD